MLKYTPIEQMKMLLDSYGISYDGYIDDNNQFTLIGGLAFIYITMQFISKFLALLAAQEELYKKD